MSNDSEIRLVTERLAEMMPDLLDAIISTLKNPQRVFFFFNTKQIPCSTCVIRRCSHPPLMLFLPLNYLHFRDVF